MLDSSLTLLALLSWHLEVGLCILRTMSLRKTKKDYLVFFVIITIGLTLLLWFHLEIRRISYENQLLTLDKKNLLEENQILKIEYAQVASPLSIEKMAEEKLNLKRPKEKQFRYIR